ncbi:hypothetical protein JVU11DRAFT_2631 [Chiua virens]|nr:hypothetical protein JVU11DRAFT_2631 [Chiua virens]
MSSTSTPVLDALAAHLPTAISKTQLSSQAVETLLVFALGGDCPTNTPDVRQEWSRNQPAALKALQNVLGTKGAKRARDTDDTDDASSKRPKTATAEDDARDPPLFTLPSISTTSPVRKKVDVTIHARSIRFINPTSRTLEASIPLASITRAFLLPTRGKSKGHWTVVLLPTDVPDKSKSSPASAQQVIFGLDALSAAKFETTSYSGTTPTSTTHTVTKGEETAPSIRRLLSHIPVPLFEPSTTVFRSACATPKSGDGAAGIDAYLSAKSGTLWFFDTGILWGESKPCEFWAVSDLLPKDGVRLISATGRTCSVILTRNDHGEAEGEDGDDVGVVETEFSMVDGREQDPVNAWTRNRKHLFGKNASQTRAAGGSGSNKDTRPNQPMNGTVKGSAWDDSDSDDDDFEASSEDLEHSSSGSESDGGEGRAGSEDEPDEEEGEEEVLDAARHLLLRPGAMPRMSKAAIDMVVDMVHDDLVGDASDEEDELEE